MLRFEYYILKKQNNLSYFYKHTVAKMMKEIEYLGNNDIIKARRIIAEKDVDVILLGNYYYNNNGLKKYNCDQKKVTKCLSKEQWELVKKYYRSIKDSSDERDDNI